MRGENGWSAEKLVVLSLTKEDLLCKETSRDEIGSLVGALSASEMRQKS